MLTRIVKLIEAGRALRAGRLEEAISLASHESIRSHRKAAQIRSLACDQLVARAAARRERGELRGAYLDLRSALAELREHREARALLLNVQRELDERGASAQLQQNALEEARRLQERGLLDEAQATLLPFRGDAAADRLRAECQAQQERIEQLVERARQAVRDGLVDELAAAIETLRATRGAETLAEEFEAERRRLQVAARRSAVPAKGPCDLVREEPWSIDVPEVRQALEEEAAAFAGELRAALAKGDTESVFELHLERRQRRLTLLAETDVESVAAEVLTAHLELEDGRPKSTRQHLAEARRKAKEQGVPLGSLGVLEKRAQKAVGEEGRDGLSHVQESRALSERSAKVQHAQDVWSQMQRRIQQHEFAAVLDLGAHLDADLVACSKVLEVAFDALQPLFASALENALRSGPLDPVLAVLARPEAFTRLGDDWPVLYEQALSQLEKARAEERRRLDRMLATRNTSWPSDEARARARQLVPDHPCVQVAEPAGLETRSTIERIEGLADRHDYSGAWHELKSVESAGPFRTRVFDLKRRVQREMGLGSRFFLKVEESGEYLVLTEDIIRIGNARAAMNDLPILANISSSHLEIHRKVSFSTGVTYTAHPLPGKPTFLDGKRLTEPAVLADQARLRLGDTLEIDFTRPSTRSHSALLRLRDGFEVQGVDRVLLMKPGGKDGRILVGPGQGAVHVRAKIEAMLELHLDAGGELRASTSLPIEIDGVLCEARDPVLPGGAWVQCGGVGLSVDPG